MGVSAVRFRTGELCKPREMRWVMLSGQDENETPQRASVEVSALLNASMDDFCQCGHGGARPVFHARWCEVRIDWGD